jgi:PDZ domain
MQQSTILRIRRVLSGAVSAGVAAFVVVVAADFARPGWYGDLLRWLQPAPRLSPSRAATPSVPIGPPVVVTPMRPKGNDSSVSPVSLPLILVRTEPGRNSREGLAQLGVLARSPQTYTAGALLANGARLIEIYDHYVVLERGGRAARLYLQGEENSDTGASRALLSVGGTPEPAPVVIDSENELTDYLRPSPVFVGNELHGYVLSAGRKTDPFSQLGLVSGDVLTQINGTPVSDSSNSLTALHSLMDGEVLTVQVERQGISQTLSLDGSILTQAASTEPEVIPSATVEVTTRETAWSTAFPSLLTPGKSP